MELVAQSLEVTKDGYMVSLALSLCRTLMAASPGFSVYPVLRSSALIMSLRACRVPVTWDLYATMNPTH